MISGKMKAEIGFLFIIMLLDRYSRIDFLVDTKVGLISGIKATAGHYSEFTEILYAKVDEANPFGSSYAYPPFDKVFDAHDDSALCIQIEEFNNTVVGIIDCIHLNVSVASSACSKNRQSVVFRINGEEFLSEKEVNLTAPVLLAERCNFNISDNFEALSFLSTDDPKLDNNISVTLAADDFYPYIENGIPNGDVFTTDYVVKRYVPKAKGKTISTGCNHRWAQLLEKFTSFTTFTLHRKLISIYVKVSLGKSGLVPI